MTHETTKQPEPTWFRYPVAAAAVAAILLWAQSTTAQELTLEEVLEQVPERHETHRITQLEIRESRAVRRQAFGRFLPRLNVSGDITRQGGEEVEIGDEAVRRRYDWGVNAVSSLTLFDGPAYFDWREADALVEASEATAGWERHLLEMNAEMMFYALAAAQQDVATAEAAVDWRRDYLEQARALVEADMAVQLDVNRARTEVLEAEQQLLEAQAALKDTADELAELLGRDPDGQLRADIDPDQLEVASPDERGDVRQRRLDFTARTAAIDAAELSRRGVWWGFVPRIDLNLNTSWGEPTAFDPDYFNWSVSLSASWNLFDGGARLARADAAQANVRRQQLELERDLREANVELAAAWRNWRSFAAAVDVAEEQLEVAEATYEQTLAQFEQDLVSSLEVSDASQQLLEAEFRLNRLRLQARLAEVQYRYLIEQE